MDFDRKFKDVQASIMSLIEQSQLIEKCVVINLDQNRGDGLTGTSMIQKETEKEEGASQLKELLSKSRELLKRCSLNISRNHNGKFGIRTESFCEKSTADHAKR